MTTVGSIFKSDSGSTFTVFGLDGDSGYKIYCHNGHWSCIYDHDMGMAYSFWEGQEDRYGYNPATPTKPRKMRLELIK